MIIRWAPHSHDAGPVPVKAKLDEERILESATKHPRLSIGHLMIEWQKVTLGPAKRSHLPSNRKMQWKLKRVKKAVNHQPSIPLCYDELREIR
jgi:hypothetical protein